MERIRKWCQEAWLCIKRCLYIKIMEAQRERVYVKNPKYYDADNVTMDEIHIMLSADDTATYGSIQ